ncbi:MAG: transcriptional repressor [Chloroflexota bacterium]|nr:transcriptional repressor [Chloroflexota bacterium]
MTNTSLAKRIKIWQETLQENDCRLTAARQTVMNILASSETALTPQNIYNIARDDGQSLGIASVYRTLETLAKFNLIQRIHQPGGCQAYWPALVGHKHFMICKKCGRIEVFEGQEDLNNLFQKVEEESGYQIQEHWLQLFGICEQCQ